MQSFRQGRREKKYAPTGIFDLVEITSIIEPGPRPWQGRIILLDNSLGANQPLDDRRLVIITR